jgi:pseudouridine-5'-phosphate glycosidase
MEPNLQTESIAYAVQLRTAGTTTVIASTTLTPRSSRIYTFFSRGLVGGLSAGAPSATVNIPAITFYTNR